MLITNDGGENFIFTYDHDSNSFKFKQKITGKKYNVH